MYFIFLEEVVEEPETIWTFLQSKLTSIISTAVIIVAALIILLIIRIITNKYVKKQQSKRRHAATLAKMICSIARYAITILAFFLILNAWGVDIMPVLAGAGIVALAIGLGAQKLIGDLIDGIGIVFEDQYSIDDVVEIDGFKGRVVEIGLRSTRLINWKNELKIIANGSVGSVINYSRYPSVGVVEVEIAYKEKIDEVFALLDEHLPQIKELYPQLVEGPNIVGVMALGSSGVTIRVSFKTTSEQQYEVERGMRKFIKDLFDANGIEIPFPQVVVHSNQSNENSSC